jgi:transcriptional regulator with XRE-family HTH domain
MTRTSRATGDDRESLDVKAPTDRVRDPSGLMRALGEALREARGGRFTIEELARQANVSAGRISQIERGIGNPSFETLWKLASTLEVPIGSLFPAGADQQQMVVRKNNRRRLEIPRDRLVYEMLTPNGKGRLEILLLDIPPGYNGGSQPSLTHDGEKFIHVYQGELLVSVAGNTWTLCPGDSITFDATDPHFVANHGADLTRIQIVVTPPAF